MRHVHDTRAHVCCAGSRAIVCERARGALADGSGRVSPCHLVIDTLGYSTEVRWRTGGACHHAT